MRKRLVNALGADLDITTQLQSCLTQPQTQALLLESAKRTLGEPGELRKLLAGVDVKGYVRSVAMSDTAAVHALRR